LTKVCPCPSPDETVIDRTQRDVSPGLAQIGFDGDDRGGVFLERGFTPINTEQVQVRLTPQFFAQKAVEESGGNVFDPGLYVLERSLMPRWDHGLKSEALGFSPV